MNSVTLTRTWPGTPALSFVPPFNGVHLYTIDPYKWKTDFNSLAELASVADAAYKRDEDPRQAIECLAS